MHGEAKLLLKFLDGSDNRYIIPVYFGIIVTSLQIMTENLIIW